MDKLTMNPTYLKKISINHSVLKGQLEAIEEIFYPIIKEIIAQRKRRRLTFYTDYGIGYEKLPRVFSVDGFISVNQINLVGVIFNCYEEGRGGADEDITVSVPTKVISDFFFDRPSFDKFLRDEYDDAVSKYLKTKLEKQDEEVKAEYDHYIELKKKFESPDWKLTSPNK